VPEPKSAPESKSRESATAIVYFDEASILETHEPGEGFSVYHGLARVLSTISHLRIAFVVVSTNPLLTGTSPPSNNVGDDLKIFAPYTALAFDSFAVGIVHKSLSLADVSNIEFFVRFGRSL
jgi:hypothetical protein